MSRSVPPGHSVRCTSACSPPGSMRSHASGAAAVARRPAWASRLATLRRSAALRYCMTIEWKTTLATPAAGAARRAASHAGAPAASIAAGALDHAAAALAGRQAVREHVDQAHRRRALAPARAALLVAVVVPAQVQARAGAELEQAKRQAGLARDEQEAAQERCRAPDLVRLHGRAEQRAQH